MVDEKLRELAEGLKKFGGKEEEEGNKKESKKSGCHSC